MSLVCLGSHWALLWLRELVFVTSSLCRLFQGMTYTSLVLVSDVIASGLIHSYSLVLLNPENVGTSKCPWVIKEA